MNKLAIKGYIKSQEIKQRLSKPFNNRRGDDNGQTGGRHVGGILGLVILLGAGFTFIAAIVLAFTGGMSTVTTWLEKFKSLGFPTT